MVKLWVKIYINRGVIFSTEMNLLAELFTWIPAVKPSSKINEEKDVYRVIHMYIEKKKIKNSISKVRFYLIQGSNKFSFITRNTTDVPFQSFTQPLLKNLYREREREKEQRATNLFLMRTKFCSERKYNAVVVHSYLISVWQKRGHFYRGPRGEPMREPAVPPSPPPSRRYGAFS